MSASIYGRGILLFGIDNPGILRRQWDRAVRAAAMQTLVYWWERLRRKHFEEGNIGRYKYKSRKRSTQFSRKKKWGHYAALVQHPLHSPPGHRDTLEKFMQEFPLLRRKNRDTVEARWATPGVAKQYRDEATTVNHEDAHLMAVRFHRILLSMLRGKTWRAAPFVKSTQIVTARDLRRFRRRVII